jgi:hypothetical protein
MSHAYIPTSGALSIASTYKSGAQPLAEPRPSRIRYECDGTCDTESTILLLHALDGRGRVHAHTRLLFSSSCPGNSIDSTISTSYKHPPGSQIVKIQSCMGVEGFSW